ncbi:transmembrane protein 17B [Neodiprion pinetum]|uniref:Transmembrane protein 17B n=1 Tax=Neodiprion lecontei TaxID=441921 RepID=A0A6J0BPX8_NEOLC|nr:transmembrane protein 17B [Neodiprion lecontei]XP_046478187.1 transmembrane protein 17B-like isoform X1 [Neodiprion pinetum]
MWKDTVISASDRIFPGLAYHNRIKEFHDIGNVIKSSLPLQMALYFNTWLFPFWFFISLNLLDQKYHKLSDIYKFITVGVFVIVAVSECIRLYLGYLGNLAEKIPELACFWLISTLIQFPLQMFTLVDGRMLPGRGEHVVNSVMLVFLLTEIITGTIALRNSANHHAKRFYLAQLYEINEKLE